jgi:ribonuclease BN (tRNA processing enzyme)
VRLTRSAPGAKFGRWLPLLATASASVVGCAPAHAPDGAGPARAVVCAPEPSPGASFEIAVLGSGGPVSAGRAASGYVVFVHGKARALVDAGPGAFVRLGEMGVDLGAIDIVLLTHLHVDHAGDLPGFVKARDLSTDGPLRFRIFGPGGAGDYPSTTAFVERLFGPEGAFGYLRGFRNRLQLDPVDLPIAHDAAIVEVVRDGDLQVSSVAVDHGDAPALAYRVEHAGHAVVFSGDLASRDDNLVRLARGADLLVYDTTVLDPPGSPAPLYDLHTTPSRIGQVAAQADVKALLLSHLTVAVERSETEVLRSVHASYPGPTTFARDCLRFGLGRPGG